MLAVPGRLCFACRCLRMTAALWGAVLVFSFSTLNGCFPTRPSPHEPKGAQVLAIPQDESEKVLFTINGRPLTRGEYFKRIVTKFGAKSLQSEIIGEELFLQEAERRGIAVTDDEIRGAVDSFVEGMAQKTGGTKKLAAEYVERGLTLEDLKNDLVPRVTTDILMRKVAKAMRPVDDTLLREYYEQTYKKKRFVTRHIAYGFMPKSTTSPKAENGGLKLQALQRAQRALDRIRGGADFATIARMESDDKVTAASGGELGPITDSYPLPPEFKEVIFALKPGEVSEPVENPRAPGFHLFQVTEILPGESYVDCADRMKEELREREATIEEVAATLKQLRDKADIRWGG